METILNENDMVVGATFQDGTIQDYIDENNTHGLIRIKESTCKWFLYNKDESADDIQALYKEIVTTENHFIKDDFGEEIVLFEKTGESSFEAFIQKIDEYLDAEIVDAF